ncbi:hypothetical protein Slala02_21150 [Streptomyces lavendulae subsp. lavendulae]|nr:hypothetical protein Slala01_15950 [Streptomyces lavendulae subsp. lavendulae]GLX26295.1 hypothetical protein Slala02_21150 [Streptomyces lavendulae subsp. lavendulae]
MARQNREASSIDTPALRAAWNGVYRRSAPRISCSSRMASGSAVGCAAWSTSWKGVCWSRPIGVPGLPPEPDPDAEPDADPDTEPDPDPDAEPEPDALDLESSTVKGRLLSIPCALPNRVITGRTGIA